MAWEERIEANLGDIRRDFNLGLSRKEFGGPTFGEYGTFLSVYVRHPVKISCPRVYACPASDELPFRKSYGNYNAGHDGKRTISPKISYDRLDHLDDSLAILTLSEAEKLRSSADRLKTAGDGVEVIEIYLHAGLKFLKGAYLLECCTVPRSRSKDTPDAFHCYIDAAKLFKYCAETSENNGKIELAVLSYKCMEVAYFRVAFALQNICSTSQSIIHETVTKMSSNLKPKNDNALHLKQLLSISQYAAAAVDASKRYRALEFTIRHHSECLSPVKKALDFSFHNVEDFVRIITLSLEEVGI